MKTFFFYIRLYFSIAAQYIKARMEYRDDFIISCVGMLMGNITGLLSLWILFRSIPSLAGWSFDELTFLYAFCLLSTTPTQLFFDHIWQLRVHIQSGTFIKYYFKPLNMMFYYLSEMIDIKGFAQLIFAIVILVISSLKIGVFWGPLQIVQLLLMIVSASLILISLLTISACTAFWITNSFSVMSLVTRLRDFSRYPMTIFNSVFKFLFTWILPIGFIAFYPVRAIIHPEEAGLYIYFTPLVGGVLYALTVLVWNRGVRYYNGTGS